MFSAGRMGTALLIWQPPLLEDMIIKDVPTLSSSQHLYALGQCHCFPDGAKRPSLGWPSCSKADLHSPKLVPSQQIGLLFGTGERTWTICHTMTW